MRHKDRASGRFRGGETERLTSDDAEELLDPHVDIDPAEELVHVTSPALQRRICRPRPLAGPAHTGACSNPITRKNSTEPAQHQLQPLGEEERRKESAN